MRLECVEGGRTTSQEGARPGGSISFLTLRQAEVGANLPPSWQQIRPRAGLHPSRLGGNKPPPGGSRGPPVRFLQVFPGLRPGPTTRQNPHPLPANTTLRNPPVWSTGFHHFQLLQ